MDLREAAQRSFARTSVFLAYAFGSRVWGAPRNNSDLDVGYYLFPQAQTDCLILQEDLLVAGELSDAIGIEVDLRCLARAPLQLRGHVLESGRRIYCADDVARVNAERDLLGQYHDYKAEFEQWRRLRFASMARRSGGPR